MADQRGGGISWTNETWNPIRGCSKVSEGCRNCYAMNVAARFSGPGQPYEGLALQAPARWTGQVKLVEDKLKDPLRWKRPRLIFVNSMSDLFHESLTFEQIDQIVAVMALARQHTFQVLTKRPERMAAYLASRAKSIMPLEAAARALGYTFSIYPDQNPKTGSTLPWPLRNVWWGTSVEDQAAADERLPHLLACRGHAAVLWLSMEPLLGPVTLVGQGLPGEQELRAGAMPGRGFLGGPFLDWVVVGGESGTNARPMFPAWVRSLLDECLAAWVPFHFKQWGEWTPGENVTRNQGKVLGATFKGVGMKTGPLWTFSDEYLENEEGHIEDEPDLYRVGKKAAGRLLDGVQHDAMPMVGQA